jgi:hypothetical protein
VKNLLLKVCVFFLNIHCYCCLGIIDEGVQHLCNAIILCGQPEQLLAIFQQTLPMEYPKIIEELPHAQAVSVLQILAILIRLFLAY